MAKIAYTNQRGVNAPIHSFLDSTRLVTAQLEDLYRLRYNQTDNPADYGEGYGFRLGYSFDLVGENFTYVDGLPTGGTVTSIRIRDASANLVAEITDLSADLKTFSDALATGSASAVATLFTDQAVTQTGSSSIDNLVDYGSGGVLSGMGAMTSL